MKQERMQLKLKISEKMNKVAANYETEHTYIRLSASGRRHYSSKDWKNVYINIPGTDIRLVIRPAWKEDLKSILKKELRTTGFITSKTYSLINNKTKIQENKIWISDDSTNITIGADPEFVFVLEDGKAEYADIVVHDFNIGKWNEFGSDGPCAELRPPPSDNLSTFINNVTATFNKGRITTDRYIWRGGASYSHPLMDRTYPIGGHIHLGVPSIINASDEDVQRTIVGVLDQLVALPLIRIDKPNPLFRRKDMMYGRCGDCILYDYKFEWRTPSGIWLVKKELAQAVLGATKATAEAAWTLFAEHKSKKKYLLSKDFIKYFDVLNTSDLIDTIDNTANVSVTLLNEIKKKFRNLPTYFKYKTEIDTFIRMCSKKAISMDDLNHLQEEWL